MTPRLLPISPDCVGNCARRCLGHIAGTITSPSLSRTLYSVTHLTTFTMSSRTEREIPPFPDDVPTANIITVDFDLLKQGDQSQAKAVFDAARGYGFFYIKNHHVDSDFMFDLANELFNLPQEEKDKYDMGTTGGYFGYKRSGAQYIDEKGTKDQSEFYNVSKDDILRVGDNPPLQHPQPVNDKRKDLEEFMRSSHAVVSTVARALSEQLGLRPNALPELHRLDRTGGDQARVTHAPPVDANTITLGKFNSWLSSHTASA